MINQYGQVIPSQHELKKAQHEVTTMQGLNAEHVRMSAVAPAIKLGAAIDLGVFPKDKKIGNTRSK
ncbi:hypothetical protein [Loigolactobacillus backii]|uniref:Uncharacterized protein n=1 Tax=Loigolactobacillus backii TaxID=375175 RepID=A0A192H363_9LACO|nr:hypothetical protein [Loigolactobacillus backii]ANK59918.1 hypothetical protein AYR52_06375 [Loigolactobacillus backii]ANK63254.1 hypothetical protein AYR53_11040 [Loigolactobacillus backii]ANK64852.1 hypothetical protein AYR54_06055 [Loigolactobacillus backii]ANK66701.1 hypothetical protein AYR55_02700 [Loigolactobacillus backii]ANK69740.1 hypothetical protein AYR56_05965 [Loigolactobacillus backii]